MTMEASQLLKDFEAHLSNPEDYLNPSPELKARCLTGVKTLFDCLQNHCRQQQAQKGVKAKKLSSAVPTGPLQELYVEGFDVEQIWEQIQLVNEPMIAHLSKEVEKISQWDIEKLTRERKEKVVVSDSDSDGMADSESDIEGEKNEYFSEGDADSLEESSDGGEEGDTKKAKKAVGERKTVVDDRFFKLAEMEKFLEKVEREQEKQRGIQMLP